MGQERDRSGAGYKDARHDKVVRPEKEGRRSEVSPPSHESKAGPRLGGGRRQGRETVMANPPPVPAQEAIDKRFKRSTTGITEDGPSNPMFL
ncbi:hypothetical protein AAE478_003039 [Parahypoxylon ruwenzoriense]